MIAGKLKAVVCTATLDLGIDWGDVDLVVNVGAPKGASRIMQRIGRSNHRMDEPSKAYLVPANRFEILECRAALDAVHEAAQDTPDARIGALDVLCQHILGVACAEPFRPEELYDEIVSAAPYAGLTWEDFEACVAFVATGGYALRAYERFAKIVKGKDGLWRVRNARVAQQYRLNVGTIVEATMIKVRLGKTSRARPGTVVPRGRILGEIEEYFAETLTPRDTFLFAGEILRFEGIVEDGVLVTRASAGTDPKIPAYDGGKFPLSTFLAARVRGDPRRFLRVGPAAGPDDRMAAAAAPAVGRAGGTGPPGRDLSPRRALLHDVLSLRGQAGAPDPRHAADPADGPGRPEAVRIRRQRLRPCRLGQRSTSRRASGGSRASLTTSSPRTCWATISRTGSPRPP